MREDWTLTTIGEACRVVNGGTPKTKVPEYWDGEHQWITPAEMGGRPIPYVAKTARALTNAGLQNSSARLLPPQSLILSSRAPIGYVVINTKPMAFNQGCKGLVPGEGFDHKYLYYYLTSIIDLLNNLGTGATFKELSGGKLKSVPLPRPSVSEQKRIVAILDEAFAGIDAAVANAEKNLANARELFESHLNAIFASPGEAWVEAPLWEAVGTVYTGPFGSLLHKRDYVIGGTPLVNPANIAGGEIIPDEKKTVDQTALDRLNSYVLRVGDIVIGRRGEMGRCAVVTDVEAGWLCGTGSFFIRTLPTADPDFVGHLLRSAAYRSQLERIATGATMKNLSNKALSKLTVSMPPIEKQRTIVSRLNQLGREVGRMEDVSSRRLGCLAGLRQSILQKAFTGELTAKEADKEMAAA